MNSSSSLILLGATSIVGWNFYRAYPDRIIPFCNVHNKSKAVRHLPRIRLNDPEEVQKLFQTYPRHTFIYCDAICDVSMCEANPEWAYRVNVESLENFSRQMPRSARLVYLSSDHVFGEDGAYHKESAVCPISVYGRTRVAAEAAVKARDNSLIIRAGLVLGQSVDGKTGHIDWLKYRHKNRLPVTMISDEARSVIWAHALAPRLLSFAQSKITGLRHITAPLINRVRLAQNLLAEMKIDLDFQIKNRAEQSYPHLGKIELKTLFENEIVDEGI